jgi:hypothetical protein
MPREFESLLESGLLSVPADFTDRVLRELEGAPLPAPRRIWPERLQWLALAGGIAASIVPLSAFIFGLWAATAAS